MIIDVTSYFFNFSLFFSSGFINLMHFILHFATVTQFELCCKKTCIQGFQPGPNRAVQSQKGLVRLEISDLIVQSMY